MYYPIQLDKARNIKYGMRAIDTLEKKLKKKITQIDMNDLSMDETATLFWAGLVHEDRDLTPTKVMDLVDDYSSVKEMSEIIGKAIRMQMGVPTAEDLGETLPQGLEETEEKN